MKNLLKSKKTKERTIFLKLLYSAAAIILTVLLWHILAVTAFKTNKVMPAPMYVFKAFFNQLSNKYYYTAIFNTLLRSILGFLIAFVIGLFLSVIANLNVRIKYFLDPIVSVLRSLPTLGVTFILLIFYPSSTAVLVIGILITMPLVYAGGYEALNNIDKRLIEMANVYKISKLSQVFGIYLPACMPYIFSSLLGGFGLNLKITIAAETVTIPRLCIGGYLYGAYASADYPLLFAWILTAIAITLLCEGLIKLVMRLSMPNKYPLRNAIIKKAKAVLRRNKKL